MPIYAFVLRQGASETERQIEWGREKKNNALPLSLTHCLGMPLRRDYHAASTCTWLWFCFACRCPLTNAYQFLLNVSLPCKHPPFLAPQTQATTIANS